MFSSEIFVRFIKYSFWFGIINQFKILQQVFYDSFISIATAFGINTPDLNGVWNKLISNLEKILNIFNSWGEYMFLGKIETFPQMMLLLIALILLICLIIKIMLELMVAKIQFFFVTGIAAFFIPFEVFEKTRRLLGGKLLNAALFSGLSIIVILIMVSVVIGALENVGIEKLKTLKELKDGYEEIIRYLIIGGIGTLLIRDNKKVIDTLNAR